MVIKFSSGDAIDWNATGIDQIKNNVLNILRTRLSEIPYMPTLGISPDYVDTPLALSRGELVRNIRQQLNNWESAAMLDDLTITPNESGDYNIEVVISL